MNNIFAKAVSYLLHPLLMPTYGTLLLFYQVESYLKYIYNPPVKKFFTLLIFLLTFLGPALITTFLVFQNKVSSLRMMDRKERKLPFLFTSILYISTYILLIRLNVNQTITALFLASTVSVLITFIITLFWKISAHMVGIAGLAGGIYGIMLTYQLPTNYQLLVLFLAAGIVGSARIQLKQHSLNQVLAGTVLGFLSCFLILKMFI